MNFPFRVGRDLLLAFLSAVTLHAQPAFPFAMDKQFSADQFITTKDGTTMTTKIYMDNGRIRNEMRLHGMDLISIVLPDQQKAYSVMPEQKMVMVMPYDRSKFKNPGAALLNTKFDLVGPETVEGILCNKYQGVTPDKKSYFLWADAVRKIPVKMTAEDGSFTVLWKNYQTGPQDPTLFVVPSGYQTINMPSAVNLPTGQ
jgi:hypothetical protein